MLDFEIIFQISKQLPWRARKALAGADFNDAQTIITRLQYIDLNPIPKNEVKGKENNKNEKQES